MKNAIRGLLCVLLATKVLTVAQAGNHLVELKVSPQSYKVCAADMDVARVTFDISVVVANISNGTVILAKSPANPVPLGAVSVQTANVDDFPTVAPRLLRRTTKPPESDFVRLLPGESYSYKLDGWFLASRGKSLAGTLSPGTYEFSGVLDPWPFDRSNYEELARKWAGSGRLWGSKTKLPPFTISFGIGTHLAACSE
jgi:hypothetical protein